MNLVTERAFVGARGADSLPFSSSGTLEEAKALKASGIDFFVGYLGVINATRLGHLIEAGIAFMPCTLANKFDGALAVASLKALGIPAGVTVWLDLEGRKIFDTAAPVLIAAIDAWSNAVIMAGYMPGIYVGSPQPLTSEELFALKSVRYWNALSRESDRFGKLAEPSCGWCMWQMNPSIVWRDTGVLIDINILGADFKGRVPSWSR